MTLDNLPRPEKAAGMLAEKSSAMIPPLGKNGTVTSCCNSGGICNSFKHRRLQIRAGLVALKLHLDSDVKRKVVK
jgi:hypothetical protein